MTLPYFSPDTRDLLALLERHEVRYLLVGAVSVIYHARPRYTGDVDIFYDPAPENAARLHRALFDFWDGRIPGALTERDLQAPGGVIQFGVAPNRIDLVNGIDGVTFEEAWADRVEDVIEHGGRKVAVRFMGKETLRRNKRAAGRPKDLDDLEGL